MSRSLPTRLRHLSLCVLVVAALSLFLVSTRTAQADTVRVSDPVEVLNVQQIVSEGSKLPYPLDVYTTNTFSGTSGEFVQRTISAHLTSKRLLVIAVDTVHRYLAIVGGSDVPLSNSQYTSAGQAFKNAAAGNHFTSATVAAIQSLKKSLTTSSSTSSSSSSSGGAILLILGIILALVIIGALIRFIRRLFGYNPPPRPRQPERETQPHYGDGRDNLGGGAVGNF